jgi:putative ABC transport system permease protein
MDRMKLYDWWIALTFGVVARRPHASTVQSFFAVEGRDAVRALCATPVVTAVGVLSLALGIGANTALFSILNSLVLRPLPVRAPEQLVILGRSDWTNPIWEEIRRRQHELFESAGAWSPQQFNLAESGRMDPVSGAYVSGGLFHTLGVDARAGRTIVPADDVRGGGDGHVVVISHRFWQQRLAAAPDVLGRRLSLNRVSFAIVGITPPGFDGPEVGLPMDLFVPIASEAAIRGPESVLDGRSSWWLRVVARLASDRSVEATAAALDVIRPAVRDATMPPEWKAEYRAGYLTSAADFELSPATTGVSDLRERFGRPLTIIMAVVGAVLLIACANIANLMLARATARRHEMSVRLALGASRFRVVSLLLTESLFLALAGGIGGLAIAKLGAALLVGQLGSEVNTVALDLSLDWRVLTFTAVVSLGATLLFGVAPALGLGKAEPNEALKEQSRAMAGERRTGVRHALVVAQVALSFGLVAGAVLFGRTFVALTSTPLGFDPSNLLIVGVDAGAGRMPPEQLAATARHVTDVAASAPGVTRASLSFLTPMSGRNWTHRVEVSGGPALRRESQTTMVNAVAPGWFETYGMRILAGRDISASDAAGAPLVVVVNEAFVRRFAGGASPLGLRVKGVGLGILRESIVVGVVNDAVYRTSRMGIVPTMYLPMEQARLSSAAYSLTLKVRGDRASVERGVTAALERASPDLAFSFRSYADQVRATIVQERLVAMLSGFFGVLALLLAALGLYGTTSYAVGRRRPEIAVRIALGASARGIVWLVLRRVAALLAFGSALGIAVSLWVGRYVESLLFGVQARDPTVLAATGVVLMGVGLMAGWLPARRASRLDPTASLRG